MNSEYQIFPLEITKAEYEALEICHNGKVAKDKEKIGRLFDNSVNKLLGMVVGNEDFQINEAKSNSSEAIHAHLA